jgi:hypothetical protein
MIMRVFLSGIVATLLMTAFVYGMALLFNKKWKVIKVLGTMLTGETTAFGGLSGSPKSIVTGTIVHYLVGIGFAIVYWWICKSGVMIPGIINSVLFGMAIGILAAAVWWLFFKFHPKPPVIRLPKYLLTIATGHIVFAIGIFILFRMTGTVD